MKTLTILALAIITLTFQNCGRLSENASLISEPEYNPQASFETIFNYEYTSAPKVFAQVRFVSKPTAKKFEDVAFIAVMGRADGANGIFDYEITLKNDKGFPICPTKSGRLTGGGTSISDGCVSQVNSESVTVDLKVTEVEGSKKTTYTFQRKY